MASFAQTNNGEIAVIHVSDSGEEEDSDTRSINVADQNLAFEEVLQNHSVSDENEHSPEEMQVDPVDSVEEEAIDSSSGSYEHENTEEQRQEALVSISTPQVNRTATQLTNQMWNSPEDFTDDRGKKRSKHSSIKQPQSPKKQPLSPEKDDEVVFKFFVMYVMKISQMF